MKYGIAAAALAALVALVAAVTRFAQPGLRADTVTVELAFPRSQTARAAAVDEALLNALERGHVGDELRHRLNRPPAVAQLARFWADACEVRQIDFERFARRHNSTATAASQPRIASSSSGHRIAGLLQSPASGVDFAGAAAYCRAAGGRLPWAEEWEALASGPEGRLYPWGDQFTDAPWPYQDSDRNAAQPCAAHPAAASPAGVHDLAGNAMEWSRGARAAFFAGRIPRPAAHGAPAVRSAARALYALAFSRLEIRPQTRSHHLSFRCVYDQPPAAALPWGAATQAVEIPPGDYPTGAPADLKLARVAALLPANQHRQARRLVAGVAGGGKARRIRVSRCEVSRRDYAAFLNHPLVKFGLFANEHEPRAQDYTPRDWARQLLAPDLPVTGVDWWAADAFARWAGGRLPGVEEWQLAAAGASANAYPWGDDYAPGTAATGDRGDGKAGPQPCAAAAGDATARGISDLGGNVSEWTRSLTADGGDYAAWVQGGNWILPGKPTARSVFGRPVPLGHRSPSIGFRVVYD